MDGRKIDISGERTWGAEPPAEIARLECSLASAYHAFDDIDEMPWKHRMRVVDEISGDVPEAAAAAARAGHGRRAEIAVRAAALRRPAWASRSTGWDYVIDASLAAIELTPSPIEVGAFPIA